MRKFFAFIVAAATLMVGCNPTPTPTPGEDPVEDEFLGMTLNASDVINLGDINNDGTNKYLIYMYKMEGSGDDAAATRIVAAEITTPEVNDGIIPEGKYTVADGTLKEGEITPTKLDGSAYVRNTEEGGFIMLVTEGSFEVKHLENGGYQFTAKFEGIDSETGAGRPKQECRFEGEPNMAGLPASNNFDVYTPVLCQATYASLGDGLAIWDIFMLDANYYYMAADEDPTNDKFPAHATEIVIITEDLGPDVLPQGTYDVDYLGVGMIGSQYVQMNVTFNSANEDDMVIDTPIAGKMTIKALGEGKYTIENVGYGMTAWKQTYSGDVQLFDENGGGGGGGGSAQEIPLTIASAEMMWNGDGHWTIALLDETTTQGGIVLYMEAFNDPATASLEAGLASGTYEFNDTLAPMTVEAGYATSQGVGGSLALTGDMQRYYDILSSGELTVVNNGDGTYSFSVGAGGDTYFFVAEYSGEVAVYDGTTGGGGNTGGGNEGGNEVNIAFDEAMARFQGPWESATYWILFLAEYAGDNLFYLSVNTPADNTAEAGLPTGTYTVDTSMAPYTIDMGFVDNDGYVNGSFVLNLEQTSVKNIIVGGSAEITNNGDGTYAITTAFEDYYGDTIIGTFSGEMPIADDSQAAAPAKVLKSAGYKMAAPAKAKAQVSNCTRAYMPGSRFPSLVNENNTGIELRIK